MAIKKSQEVCLLTLLGLALAGCGKKHSPKPLPKNPTAHCESHKNAAKQRFVTAISNTENTVQEGLPSISPTDTTAAPKTIAVVAPPQKATDVGNAADGAGQLGATAAVGDEEGLLPQLLVQDGSLAEEKAHLSSLEEEEVLQATDTEGNDALHVTDEKIIRILSKVGTDVNAKDEKGWSPLHHEAWENSADNVQTLVYMGANVNAKDLHSRRPLHYAAKLGHIEAARALIKAGAGVNKKDVYGQTALHVAAKEGYAEVVRELIENGAKIDAKDKEGQSPLHHAVWENSADNVQTLVDRGANVNAKDRKGWSLLHYAAWKDRAAIVPLLIKQDTTKVNAKDDTGWSPLHVAAFNNYTGTVQALREEGASIYAKDSCGLTPLHYVVWNNREATRKVGDNEKHIQKELVDLHMKTIKALLEGLDKAEIKALLAAKDNWGATPLNYAAQQLKEAIAQYHFN